MMSYQSVRQQSVRLITGLSAEDTQLQSMPDASPLKWHLAHTTWFFETFLLKPHCDAYQIFDPRFEFLFNSYYDSVGARHPRPQRGLLSRPSLEQVLAYRRHVDDAMATWLNAIPEELKPVLTIGLHHEMQHQELMLTDFKHALWQNLYAFEEQLPSPASHVPIHSGRADWIEFSGGTVRCGHSDPTSFAYDCESPAHSVYLAPYALARYPVTNQDWLEFIADNGYQRSDLWLSEGFALAQQEQWRAPLYWDTEVFAVTQDPSDIRLMTWHGWQTLDPAEPVCHISLYEADAFARWAGARLPTEFEWEHAVAEQHVEGHFADSDADSGKFHPRPATSAHSAKPAGMFGNVWEWTQSPFSPYPGFHPAQGALAEYNGKFMINQYVLRGGSCASPGAHIRPSYRNFFHPHQRWQFSGLRLAKDGS